MPASSDGRPVVVDDGKKIDRLAMRLPTRNRPDKPYGAKLLVADLTAERVAVGLAADADGEANGIRPDRTLVQTVCGVVAGPRLWVADRQFCDLIQPRRFADGEDHFVVRSGRNTSVHADDGQPPTDGTLR